MTTVTAPSGEATSVNLPPVTRLAGQTQQALREKFPPREVPTTWATTTATAEEVLAQIDAFHAENAVHHNTELNRRKNAVRILEWLSTHPGGNWNQRWHNSTAEEFPDTWPETIAAWFEQREGRRPRRAELKTGVLALIRADVLRPSIKWLLVSKSPFLRETAALRDPVEFGAISTDIKDPRPCGDVAQRISIIVIAKGGLIRDITVGDCLQLRDVALELYPTRTGHVLYYSWLRGRNAFPPDAPATLNHLSTHAGQVSPAELINRYHLQCRPIRDLIVDYIVERQPALDHASVVKKSRVLGRFWADLERHNPGICSLDLPPKVSAAWKDRLRFKTSTHKQPDGTVTEIRVPRISAPEDMVQIRSFYLDIAHWAVEEPSRWGPWVAPCPIKATEIEFKKRVKQQKARADQRTRERLPVLPLVVKAAHEQLVVAQERLEAVLVAEPDATFSVRGETYTRASSASYRPDSTAVYDSTGKRLHLGQSEHRAFWSWATVEFLRHTGVRIEEMLEVSHHSLVQYTLPTTGEVVPLLQIAPSKTDEERVLLVSPELADVLSVIVQRVRGNDETIPLVASYDPGERIWNPALPLLFQWRFSHQKRGISACNIRNALRETIELANIFDASGEPLHFQLHDFRRMFVTDTIASGLPPHIAMLICGHKNISTTMGYKAIYPTEAIEAHRAFIARRRSLRPSEEYRTPSDEEWDDFLGHFEKRKLSVGTCGRAYGTSCAHEHACVRCPMLRPDPTQQNRLQDIRDNLIARIAEAEREGWLGEVEGLQTSLAAANGKLRQLSKAAARQSTLTGLGIPDFSHIASREVSTPT